MYHTNYPVIRSDKIKHSSHVTLITSHLCWLGDKLPLDLSHNITEIPLFEKVKMKEIKGQVRPDSNFLVFNTFDEIKTVTETRTGN